MPYNTKEHVNVQYVSKSINDVCLNFLSPTVTSIIYI